MQKKKSEKIILSAPKTAATLIIAATLNTAPTVIFLAKSGKRQLPIAKLEPVRGV